MAKTKKTPYVVELSSILCKAIFMFGQLDDIKGVASRAVVCQDMPLPSHIIYRDLPFHHIILLCDEGTNKHPLHVSS